jgi:hypothetical protein
MGFMDSIKDLIEEKSSLERLHQDWVINTPWELHEKKIHNLHSILHIYFQSISL